MLLRPLLQEDCKRSHWSDSLGKKQKHTFSRWSAYFVRYAAEFLMQVNYKNVMSAYKLGPNGGILTACNLFATRFDQVMALCERPRSEPIETIVVDTAGQIEIFTWSASGNIITELFASSFPTVVLYVIDTPRCLNPQTFMSNMMQACSILYKTRLPMILVRACSSLRRLALC